MDFARRPLHWLFDDQGIRMLFNEVEKKKKHQHAFLDMLVHQQSESGKYLALACRLSASAATRRVSRRWFDLTQNARAARPFRPDCAKMARSASAYRRFLFGNGSRLPCQGKAQGFPVASAKNADHILGRGVARHALQPWSASSISDRGPFGNGHPRILTPLGQIILRFKVVFDRFSGKKVMQGAESPYL